MGEGTAVTRELEALANLAHGRPVPVDAKLRAAHQSIIRRHGSVYKAAAYYYWRVLTDKQRGRWAENNISYLERFNRLEGERGVLNCMHLLPSGGVRDLMAAQNLEYAKLWSVLHSIAKKLGLPGDLDNEQLLVKLYILQQLHLFRESRRSSS